MLTHQYTDPKKTKVLPQCESCLPPPVQQDHHPIQLEGLQKKKPGTSPAWSAVIPPRSPKSTFDTVFAKKPIKHYTHKIFEPAGSWQTISHRLSIFFFCQTPEILLETIPGKRAPSNPRCPYRSSTGSPLATSGNLTQLSLINLPNPFRMGASHKRIYCRFQSPDFPQNEIHLHYFQICLFFFFKETLTIQWYWNLEIEEL